MGTVSIVVATYNRSQLLKECLESLLAQTYRDIEIIVVDDGSTDGTQTVVSEIARKHDRVRYYSRPHLGASDARNFGLKQSKGEYIGFFDSDDLWPANFIEIMVKSLQAKPDFDVAYSQIVPVVNGEIGEQYVTVEKPPTGYVTADIFFRSRPFNLPSSTISRKRVWNGIVWNENLKNCDDFDVFLQISTRAKFMFVPDVCALYRRTEDSISAAVTKNLSTNHVRVMERFYFQLGGSSFVPKRSAIHKISHFYRSYALENYNRGNRKASISLLMSALFYLPLDLRLYIDLLRVLLLNPKSDKRFDGRLVRQLADGI